MCGGEMFSPSKRISPSSTLPFDARAHQGQHADTFSGTGLADNTKYLALFQMVGNIADCADGSLLRFKFCCEMADFRVNSYASPPGFLWIKASPIPSPRKFREKMVIQMQMVGKSSCPGCMVST